MARPPAAPPPPTSSHRAQVQMINRRSFNGLTVAEGKRAEQKDAVPAKLKAARANGIYFVDDGWRPASDLKYIKPNVKLARARASLKHPHQHDRRRARTSSLLEEDAAVEQASLRVERSRTAEDLRAKKLYRPPLPYCSTGTGRHCQPGSCCARIDPFREGQSSDLLEYGAGISNYFKLLKWGFWTLIILAAFPALWHLADSESRGVQGGDGEFGVYGSNPIFGPWTQAEQIQGGASLITGIAGTVGVLMLDCGSGSSRSSSSSNISSSNGDVLNGTSLEDAFGGEEAAARFGKGLNEGIVGRMLHNYVICDIIGVCFFLLLVIWLFYFEDREGQEETQNTMSVADFTVKLTGFPAAGVSEQAILDHFCPPPVRRGGLAPDPLFGKIHDIHMAEQNEDTILLFKKRGKVVRAFAEASGKLSRLADRGRTQARLAKQDAKRKDLWAEINKLNTEHLTLVHRRHTGFGIDRAQPTDPLKVSCVFLTFDTIGAAERCRSAHDHGARCGARLCPCGICGRMDKRLLFVHEDKKTGRRRRYRLKVSRANAPSNVIWENLGYTWCTCSCSCFSQNKSRYRNIRNSRCFRRILSSLATALIVLTCLGIVLLLEQSKREIKRGTSCDFAPGWNPKRFASLSAVDPMHPWQVQAAAAGLEKTQGNVALAAAVAAGVGGSSGGDNSTAVAHWFRETPSLCGVIRTKKSREQDYWVRTGCPELQRCWCEGIDPYGYVYDYCKESGGAALLSTILLSGLVSVTIMAFNILLEVVLILLVSFEKHHDRTKLQISVGTRLFLAQVANTSLLLICKSAIQRSWYDAEDRLGATRDYPLFDREWYEGTGTEVRIAMLAAMFAPHVKPFVNYARKRLRWLCCRRCVYTQAALDRLAVGGEFKVQYRLAKIFNVIFLILIFSPGIPLLLPLGAISFAISFAVDKLMFLRHYRTPPRYSAFLTRTFTRLLPVAIILHVAMGILMLGSVFALNDLHLQHGDACISTNTTTAATSGVASNATGMPDGAAASAVVGMAVAVEKFREAREGLTGMLHPLVKDAAGHDQIVPLFTLLMLLLPAVLILPRCCTYKALRKTCRDTGARREVDEGEQATVASDYNSRSLDELKQAGLLGGQLFSYNILENPLYKAAFAVSSDFHKFSKRIDSLPADFTGVHATQEGGGLSVGPRRV